VCRRQGYHHIPQEFADLADKSQQTDPRIGKVLDKYLIVGPLGQGGMGAVYIALQQPLMRKVALKIISGIALTPHSVARFEREARAVALLDHPNIVRLYDFGIAELEGRLPFMALELVTDAKRLRVILDSHNERPLNFVIVQSVFVQILHALSAAHGAGIIHRDIKPDNVLVKPVEGNPNFVKVLDFGLAKAHESSPDEGLTLSGMVVGTPQYVAPEQMDPVAAKRLGPPADLFAVGVMLYEAVAGRKPYPASSTTDIVVAKQNPKFDPFTDTQELAVWPHLREVIKKSMAFRPGERYQTAEEMAAAIIGAGRAGDLRKALPPRAPKGLAPAAQQVFTPDVVRRGPLIPATGPQASPLLDFHGEQPQGHATRAEPISRARDNRAHPLQPAPRGGTALVPSMEIEALGDQDGPSTIKAEVPQRRTPLVAAVAAGVIIAAGAGGIALWKLRSSDAATSTKEGDKARDADKDKPRPKDKPDTNAKGAPAKAAPNETPPPPPAPLPAKVAEPSPPPVRPAVEPAPTPAPEGAPAAKGEPVPAGDKETPTQRTGDDKTG